MNSFIHVTKALETVLILLKIKRNTKIREQELYLCRNRSLQDFLKYSKHANVRHSPQVRFDFIKN